jgi:NAD(P)-dependent dehydrogenase (short-subunit alcohol dehydrogenase family)
VARHDAGRLLATTFGLEGKTALVTGGGSGIGQAAARLFAAVGAKVAVAGHHATSIQATAEQIADEGGDALAVQMDIADEASVRNGFALAMRRYGRLDMLVCNAAFRPKADFMEMSVEQWDHMHNVNTRGTFLCMREAIRAMRAGAHGGAIVNVSTIGTLHPVAFSNTHYDSSKAAINALTRTSALEFAPDGIRINAVLPGHTDTDAARKIRAAYTAPRKGPMSDPKRHPMGRPAEPGEIAAAILFLASPAASFITGHLLAVDGGFILS